MLLFVTEMVFIKSNSYLLPQWPLKIKTLVFLGKSGQADTTIGNPFQKSIFDWQIQKWLPDLNFQANILFIMLGN